MRTFLAFLATLLLSASAPAQQATLEGTWRDQWGTTLDISHCGADSTRICVTLVDVRGESRTKANLAYVNEQIMRAEKVDEDEWQGTVIFEGNQAEGTLTRIAPDVVEIEGCRALILCETIAFQRL